MNSVKNIKVAVFGMSDGKQPNERLMFAANSLVVTPEDIKSLEPVDHPTRDCLQKSVTLAIQITTN